MKANEMPEKIYLFENPITNDPDDRWLSKRSDGNDIEYTRTDAFIEKACEWLKEYGGGYWMDDYDLPTDDLVSDFRNYMKGEQYDQL